MQSTTAKTHPATGAHQLPTTDTPAQTAEFAGFDVLALQYVGLTPLDLEQILGGPKYRGKLNTFVTSFTRLFLEQGAPFAIAHSRGATTFAQSNTASRLINVRDVLAVSKVLGARRPDVAVELLAAVLAGGHCQTPQDHQSVSRALYAHLCMEQWQVANGATKPREECSAAVRMLMSDPSTGSASRLMLAKLHAGTSPIEQQIAHLEALMRRPFDSLVKLDATEIMVALFRAVAAGEPGLAERAAALLAPSDWTQTIVAQARFMAQPLPQTFRGEVARMLPAGHALNDFMRDAGPLLLEIANRGIYAHYGAFYIAAPTLDAGHTVQVRNAVAHPEELHELLRTLAKVHGARRIAAEIGAAFIHQQVGSPQFRAALARDCVAWLEKSSAFLAHRTCVQLGSTLGGLGLESETWRRLVEYTRWDLLAAITPDDEYSGEDDEEIVDAEEPWTDAHETGFHAVQETAIHAAHETPPQSVHETALQTVTVIPPDAPPTAMPVTADRSPVSISPESRKRVAEVIQRLLGEDKETAEKVLNDTGLLDRLFIVVDTDSGQPLFEADPTPNGAFRMLHSTDEATLFDALARLAREHGAPLLAAELAAACLCGPSASPKVAMACAGYLNQAAGTLTRRSRLGVRATLIGRAFEALGGVRRRLLATPAVLQALNALGCGAEAIELAFHDPDLIANLEILLKAMPWEIADGDIRFPPDKRADVQLSVLQDLAQAFVRLDEPLRALQLLAGLIGSGAFDDRQNAILAKQFARIASEKPGTAMPGHKLPASGLQRAMETYPAGARGLMDAASASGWLAPNEQVALHTVTTTPAETTATGTAASSGNTFPEGMQTPLAEPVAFARIPVSSTIKAWAEASPAKFMYFFLDPGENQDTPLLNYGTPDDALKAGPEAFLPGITVRWLPLLRDLREKGHRNMETLIAAALASHVDCPPGLRITLLARCDVSPDNRLPPAMQQSLHPMLAKVPNLPEVAWRMCPDLANQPPPAAASASGQTEIDVMARAVAKLKQDHPDLHNEIFGAANETGRMLLVALGGNMLATNGAQTEVYRKEWLQLIQTVSFTGNHELAALIAGTLAGTPDTPLPLKIACANSCASSITHCSGKLPGNMQKAIARALKDEPAAKQALNAICPMPPPVTLTPIAAGSLMQVAHAVAKLQRERADLYIQLFAPVSGKPLMIHDAALGVVVATEEASGPAFASLAATAKLITPGHPELATLIGAAVIAAPQSSAGQISEAGVWSQASSELSVGNLPAAMQRAVRQNVDRHAAGRMPAQMKQRMLLIMAPLGAPLGPGAKSVVDKLSFGLDELARGAVVFCVNSLFVPVLPNGAYELLEKNGCTRVSASEKAITRAGVEAEVDTILEFVEARLRRKGAAGLAAEMAAATALHMNCKIGQIRKLLKFCLKCQEENGAVLSTTMKNAMTPLKRLCKGEDKNLLEKVLRP